MKKKTPVVFGEVLFDVFPDGNQVLGGAPFNVAWHLNGFGLDPFFISRVGKDALGREVLARMRGSAMDTGGMQTDPDRDTGMVTVSMEQGQPSYTIEQGAAWDFIVPEISSLPPAAQTGILYHGSLAARTGRSAGVLRELVRSREWDVFCDINLRPPWWTAELLREVFAWSRYVKLNELELREITRSFGLPLGDDAAMAWTLVREFGLDLLILTMGEQGAMLLSAKAEPVVRPASRARDFQDSVGAGDAFSAVVLLGLSLGWEPGDMLERAAVFAAGICSIQGALPDDNRFYSPFLAEWTGGSG